jgi:hypothetical protein
MFAPANVGRKSRATRISCHAVLDRTACAPFREERRMHCINATKSNRKSGESPSNAFGRSNVRLFIRDLLFRPSHARRLRQAPPSPCHPERSRGTCSSTDLSGKCFSVFPPELSWVFRPTQGDEKRHRGRHKLVISTEAYPDFLPHFGWQRPRMRLSAKRDAGTSSAPQSLTGNLGERSGEICGFVDLSWNYFSTQRTLLRAWGHGTCAWRPGAFIR